MNERPEGWTLVFSNQARKDNARLARSGMKPKAQRLFEIMEEDPLRSPPAVKRLRGDLEGMYSRRISQQHRIVYSLDHDRRMVYVLRTWTHYVD